MSSLQQIKVARAEQVIKEERDLEKLFTKSFIGEEKMDGARYKLHTFKDGNRLDSRRESVKDGLYVEKTDNVPHIRDYPLPAGWVVDTEVIASHGVTSHDRCANTVSIMGSLPDRALDVQREHGNAIMYAFDVLIAGGVDIRDRPLNERLQYLNEFMRGHASQYIRRMPVWDNHQDFQPAFKRITEEEKGEGLVIKDLELPYGHSHAWYKYKWFFDMDVVATGIVTQGKGKYRDTAGAIHFGLFDNGTLVEIGKCSGMDDRKRALIWKMDEIGTLAGKVFEVRGWDITKQNKVRNANFRRWRSDKNAAECTIKAQLFPNIRR